jgi:hypothetical protein
MSVTTPREQSADRRDALQKLIETGGLDSPTWFELRRQFEALPEREEKPKTTAQLPEEYAR